jgi:hypothetical protein
MPASGLKVKISKDNDINEDIINQKARTISPKSLLQHMLLGEPNDQFDPHHWHLASFQITAQLWNSNFNI